VEERNMPTPKPPLITPQRLALLRAIRDNTVMRGPTHRELGELCGYSSHNGVWDHLRQLRAAGLLSEMPFQARGTVLSAAGMALLDELDRAEVKP
jgi:hypothetical protein